MKILAEFDGWRKIIDVSEGVAHSGRVFIAILSDVPIIPIVSDKPTNKNTGAITFCLFYTGETIDGYPFFTDKY